MSDAARIDDEDVRHGPQAAVLVDHVTHHAVADERKDENEAVCYYQDDELGDWAQRTINDVIRWHGDIVTAMLQDGSQHLRSPRLPSCYPCCPLGGAAVLA